MNNMVKIGLAFVSGLVIGGFAVKKYCDNQKATEWDKEDETIKDDNTTTEKTVEETTNIEPKTIKPKSVNDVEYTRLLDELRYQHDVENKELLEEQELNQRTFVVTPPIVREGIYQITEDEFEEDYESDEYTYYTDGYVTDSYGMPIPDEDIDRIFGGDPGIYFDESGADQIYLRCDEIKMDYSIIRDLDRFVDVAPPRIKRMYNICP